MSVSYYIQIILFCLVFVAILYGVLTASKQLQKKRYSGAIKVKDRLPIDTGVTLLLIEIGGKTFFLGVGNRDVKVLDSFQTK